MRKGDQIVLIIVGTSLVPLFVKVNALLALNNGATPDDVRTLAVLTINLLESWKLAQETLGADETLNPLDNLPEIGYDVLS